MSDLEIISSELVSIAYQDKSERVESLEKLEMAIPKMMLSFPEEQKKLIKQIIAELKQEASTDAVNSFDQTGETKPKVVQEEEIEVVEPITVIQPKTIEIKSKKSKPEQDFSFLEDIDNAF